MFVQSDMSKEYINHPAYPVAPYPGDDKNPVVRSNSGMSMRDYFAGRALAALDIETMNERQIADSAYRIADALMQRRSEH
jgi:hypothetical protein